MPEQPTPQSWISAYLACELGEAESVAFEKWLLEDTAHTQLLAREVLLDSQIRAAVVGQRLEGGMSILAGRDSDEQLQAIDRDIMHELVEQALAERRRREIEEAANLKLIADQHEQQRERRGAQSRRRETRTIVIPRAAVYAAAAAVLMLAAVVMWPGAKPQPAPSPAPIASDPNAAIVMARVTDSVSAQWREGDRAVQLPVGTRLEPWQRLTLTHGFAEITSGRGAIAFLQAPCTIEVTDNDNAIRLHRGRLVGKCLTPRSKGFIVHAPGMDVVDLGTQFGVEADSEGGSSVVVMDGAVRAQPTRESPRAFKPVVLERSQARKVVPETGALVVAEPADLPDFHAEPPHPYVMAVLNDAPVAYWRFERKASGKVLNEITPGVNDLFAFGAAGLVFEGVIGGAARIDNNTPRPAYFEMQGQLETLAHKDAFTLELWYYVDRLHPNAGSIAGLYTALDTRHVAQFELQPAIHSDPDGETKNLRLHHSFGDRSSWSSAWSEWDYPIGRWQHIAVVKEDGAYKLYADGERYAEIDNVPGVPAGLRVMVGHSPPYIHTGNLSLKRPFTGLIDEVAVYDKALSAEQIAARVESASQEDSP